jgi:ribonuclease Z
MEATYAKKHANKADEYEHMTAKESALVALENNVKMLYVTHFSQRYKDTTQIEEEAREVFENTYTTYDLMSVKLKRL